MRTFFALAATIFLTSSLFAIESERAPSPKEIKAAQANFKNLINVYQAVPGQAMGLGHLRIQKLQKNIGNYGAPTSTYLGAGLRTYTYLTLVTDNRREIPSLVRSNTRYNTIAGLHHLKRQLLACAFAAIDSDTKSQLFLAYQRLSAGIKELDFALQNYSGHLHLKDAQ